MVKLRQFIKQWMVPPELWRLLSNLKYRAKNISFERGQIIRHNQALKNTQIGSRCFILGAGSSVNSQDIKKLSNEIVISVSNTFVHPDFKFVKPRYHVLPPIMQNHGNLYSEDRFVVWLKDMETATGDAEMFFHLGDKAMIERNKLFEGRVIHWVDYVNWSGNFSHQLSLNNIPKIGSVSEVAISVAVYLGFDAIYLLGIDHDWFNGLFVYFYDHKTQHAVKPDEDALPSVDSEFQMRRHADIFKKYKYLYSLKNNIYNANSDPKHYMDVFPKVEYDSLFSK